MGNLSSTCPADVWCACAQRRTHAVSLQILQGLAVGLGWDEHVFDEAQASCAQEAARTTAEQMLT